MSTISYLRRYENVTNTVTSFHTVLYGALLIFDAGILYLIEHVTETSEPEIPGEGTEAEETSSPESTEETPHNYQRSARWIASSSLSIVLFCTIVIALLHKPVKEAGDKPLFVNNRYGRLAGRLVVIVILCLFQLKAHMNSDIYMAVLTILMSILTLYEYIAGWEKDGKVIEPKHERSVGSAMDDRESK